MRRRITAFAFFVIIAMCFHACDFAIPEEVEIRVNPDSSLPLNGKMSDILLSQLQDAVKKVDGVSVYQYSDYKPDGKNEIMTFLLKYNILEGWPLDFFDEFQHVLDEFKIDLEDTDFDQKIKLDQLSHITDGIEPMTAKIDLSDILEGAEKSLTFDLEDAENGSDDIQKIIPIPLGIGNLEVLKDKYEFTITMNKFDTVTFANGILTITLELREKKLEPPLPELNGVNFSFNETYLEYELAGETYKIYGGLQDDPGSVVNFTDGNLLKDIEYKLNDPYDPKGKTIPKSFKIVIKGITDATASPQNAEMVVYHCEVLQPHPDDNLPIIKGVEGYRVNPDDEDFTFEIEDDIAMNYEGDEFVHAQIRKGSLTFKIDLPPRNDNSENDETWITLADNNKVSQDLDKDISIHQLIKTEDGEDYWGLSEITTSSTGDEGEADNPLVYKGATDGELSGKHINLSDINIKGTIKIPEGYISFMLKEEDLAEQTFDLKIEPVIEIEILEKIHIRPGNIFPPMTKNFPLGNAVKYINEIHFDEVGVEFQFKQVDIAGLQIMVTEPNLKINPDKTPYPIPEWKPGPGKNPSTPIRFFNDEEKKILKLKDADSILVDELNLTVEITGNTTGTIMEITSVNGIDISEPESFLRIEMEKPKLYFKDSWSIAYLGLDTLDNTSGSFPEEDEDPINLVSMLEMVKDFKINNIKSYLYIDAPQRFIHLEPEITMVAKDGEDGEPYDLFFNEGKTKVEIDKDKIYNIPELDKDGSGKYSGKLPDGIEVNFQSIMDDLPEDLRIFYNFGFSEEGIPITREFMENGVPDEKVDIAIVVVVPMTLIAREDDAKIEIPNMLTGEDIFERKKEGEDGPYLGYINSLTLNVEFNGNIFNGGQLYMKRDLGNDEKEADGEELLIFDLTGKSLKIPIKGAMLETIRNTYPYKIAEMGIRVKKAGKGIEMPNNLAITKIEFDADVTFGFKL